MKRECPYCGGAVELSLRPDDGREFRWFFRCTKCGVECGGLKSRETTEQFWDALMKCEKES